MSGRYLIFLLGGILSLGGCNDAPTNPPPASQAQAQKPQAQKSSTPGKPLPANQPSVAMPGGGAGAALPEGHPKTDPQSLPANPLEAMAVLQARIERNPLDREALLSFANANMMVERYKDAAALYTRALAINPKDLDVRTNLAIAQMYSNEPDKAIAELKKNLETDPKHNASLYNLGFIYYYTKQDVPAAREVWRTWLQLYPNAPGALELREQVAQIDAQLNAGKDNEPRSQGAQTNADVKP